MNDTVYLNGHYLPRHEAKVSVMDRGFLFGDGVYEVIPAYHGKFFRFSEHITRLNNSLAAIRLAPPHSEAEWLDRLTPLLHGTADQSVYLQITRGPAEKRDHAFPPVIQPTIFAYATPIVPYSGADQGVKAITLEDTRWECCHIKAITLLANILLRQQAVEQGCAEAILLKKGWVTEGAASNVFVLLNGVLLTPPKDHRILPGITRDLVVELARQHGVRVAEAAISQDDLRHAEEIWLTSSTREILPVVELDGVTVGQGVPGAAWRAMRGYFDAFKAALA